MARLTFEDDLETSFILDEESEFLLGRSKECDFQLTDSFVSRLQAKISCVDGRYVIENIGSNPIFINGTRAVKRILDNNDKLTVGKTNLVFRIEEAVASALPTTDEPVPALDQTVFAFDPVEHGPRLVVNTPEGQDRIYPLQSHGQSIIGRAADADLQLNDSSVSRKHCIIKKQGEHFFITNLSETNPITIGNRPVAEQILYSGDQIRIGRFSACFSSDRIEDVRPIAERIIYKRNGASLWAWLTVLLAVLVGAGILYYTQFYSSLGTRRALNEVTQEIAAGKYESAHEKLKKLLATHLTPKEAQTATELFSRTALHFAQQMAETGKIKEARDYLIAYLNNYKPGKESRTVRNQIDAYRFQLAQQMEASGDNLAALQEYSNISEDSSYYDQAQQAAAQIWLSTQQKQLSSQPIDKLLQEADENFTAKRYTTPFNNNAYAIYQTILSLDPSNSVAIERINQMKAFYRENGDRYFQQKNCNAALSYYERYLLIEPQDTAVTEKVATCRRSFNR